MNEGFYDWECYITLIENFFNNELPEYSFLYKQHAMPYGPYFKMGYQNEETKIELGAELGFYIDISIDNKKYNLCQYDRTVLEHNRVTENDILYQLNVLKRFLK